MSGIDQSAQTIFVHAVDNGEIKLTRISVGRKVVKTAAGSAVAGLAFLPLAIVGVAKGMSGERELFAACEKCGQSFSKENLNAFEITAALRKRVAEVGDVVLRTYTPPPIPAYDPNETHLVGEQIIQAKVEAKGRDKRADGFVRSKRAMREVQKRNGICQRL